MTAEQSQGEHAAQRDDTGEAVNGAGADAAGTDGSGQSGAVDAVHEAMAGLENLDDRPLTEHVERFDAVHTALTVALASIDKV